MNDVAHEVTPPREEPGRPRVVTAAIWLWGVLGALLVLTGLLFAIATAVGITDPNTGTGSLILTACVLVVAGAGTLAATRAVRGRSRPARAALTAIGVVLAVAGLVQLTFLGVGGVYFVAFAAGAVLLHVPSARSYFASR